MKTKFLEQSEFLTQTKEQRLIAVLISEVCLLKDKVEKLEDLNKLQNDINHTLLAVMEEV